MCILGYLNLFQPSYCFGFVMRVPPPLFCRVDRVTTKRATPSSSVNKMCVCYSFRFLSMISRREKTQRRRPKEEELSLSLSIQSFFGFYNILTHPQYPPRPYSRPSERSLSLSPPSIDVLILFCQKILNHRQ